VCIETKAMDRTFWLLNPSREDRFSVVQNVQTGSGAHPASCSMGTEILSLW